jgi:hypothetical protein
MYPISAIEAAPGEQSSGVFLTLADHHPAGIPAIRIPSEMRSCEAM